MARARCLWCFFLVVLESSYQLDTSDCTVLYSTVRYGGKWVWIKAYKHYPFDETPQLPDIKIGRAHV